MVRPVDTDSLLRADLVIGARMARLYYYLLEDFGSTETFAFFYNVGCAFVPLVDGTDHRVARSKGYTTTSPFPHGRLVACAADVRRSTGAQRRQRGDRCDRLGRNSPGHGRRHGEAARICIEVEYHSGGSATGSCVLQRQAL